MNEKTGTGVSSEKEKVKESQFNTVSLTHQPPRRGWGCDIYNPSCKVDNSLDLMTTPNINEGKNNINMT